MDGVLPPAKMARDPLHTPATLLLAVASAVNCVEFPVDAIVTCSPLSVLLPGSALPPAQTPLTHDDVEPLLILLVSVKSPKSIAFPVDEMFT